MVCQFEEAAREVADEITRPRPDGETEVEDIQICLVSNANPSNIRDLKVMLTARWLPGMVDFTLVSHTYRYLIFEPF